MPLRRARGPNLGVEERSVECDLMNGTSLCVNFARAHVVPGTQFEFANGKLVFIVPTQTSLHRFFVQMPKEDPSGIVCLFPLFFFDGGSGRR